MGATAESVPVGAPVPSLVRLGMSPDADLVYRTLVTFGPGTTAEVARALGLPARRVGEALDELVAHRAVTVGAASPGDAATWTAMPPARLLPEQRRRRMRAAPGGPGAGPPLPTELSRQLPDGFGDGWPAGLVRSLLAADEGVRYLPSRAAARARMAQLVAVARHEHLAMTSERAFDAAAARAAAPMDRALLDRGIRMRVLGLQPVYEDPLLPYRSRPAEPTPDYRQAAAVPMKLIVVDRRVALLPAVPDDLDRGYLEVVREPVVSGLLALFERHWDAAPPAAPAPCGVVLSSREHALLGLLAAGLTDAAAARRLRISPRSVTTAMRGLMDRLGAQNRFQLGLALGVARVVTAPGAAGRGEKT